MAEKKKHELTEEELKKAAGGTAAEIDPTKKPTGGGAPTYGNVDPEQPEGDKRVSDRQIKPL